jgi:hypothetical protein
VITPARVAGRADGQVPVDRFLPPFLVGAAAFAVATLTTPPVMAALQPAPLPAHDREWPAAANVGHRAPWRLRVNAMAPVAILVDAPCRRVG